MVIFLLSSLDEIDVRVELLADDIWGADGDKPGFLSVGVDIFDWLFWYKRPMYFTMVENNNDNQRCDKWG